MCELSEAYHTLRSVVAGRRPSCDRRRRIDQNELAYSALTTAARTFGYCGDPDAPAPVEMEIPLTLEQLVVGYDAFGYAPDGLWVSLVDDPNRPAKRRRSEPTRTARLRVVVPPGCADGQRTRVIEPDRPDAPARYAVVRQLPHRLFERRGRDLYACVRTEPSERRDGLARVLRHPDGRRLSVAWAPGADVYKTFEGWGVYDPIADAAGRLCVEVRHA